MWTARRCTSIGYVYDLDGSLPGITGVSDARSDALGHRCEDARRGDGQGQFRQHGLTDAAHNCLPARLRRPYALNVHPRRQFLDV
jgi:hypothetical protein